MVDSLGNNDTLLRFSGVIARAVSECFEVILTAWQHEKVRRYDLESSKVLIGDAQDFIGLIGLDEYLRELLHLLWSDWLGERDDKVVV